MKIGYSIPNNQGVENPNDLVALAVKAEQFGFDSVWVAEHLFHSSYVAERLGDKPYHEALTVLTAIACATKTVRLGTSVLVLPWHDPARLGKTIATLDQLSDGRVDIGVGVALTEDEFENLGVDFPSRGRRANEVLGAMQALWTQDTPSFSGEFYNYEGLKFSPKPRQKPYPPILVGGASKPAYRRIAQYGDGWHTIRQSPTQVAEASKQIIQLTKDAGRDANNLRFSINLHYRVTSEASDIPVQDRITLTGNTDDIVKTIQAYQAAGIDEMVINATSADMKRHDDVMSHFTNSVRPRL
jgi:probable F420-dependent oxidoreductase